MGMLQSEDSEEEEPRALRVEFRAVLQKPEVSNRLINRRLPARESRDGNGADSACFPFPLPPSSIANKKRKSRVIQIEKMSARLGATKRQALVH